MLERGKESETNASKDFILEHVCDLRQELVVLELSPAAFIIYSQTDELASDARVLLVGLFLFPAQKKRETFVRETRKEKRREKESNSSPGEGRVGAVLGTKEGEDAFEELLAGS